MVFLNNVLPEVWSSLKGSVYQMAAFVRGNTRIIIIPSTHVHIINEDCGGDSDTDIL